MDTREQQADKSKGAPWVCHNGHVGCGMPSGHPPDACRDERQRYHVYQIDLSGEVRLVYAEEIRLAPRLHIEGGFWQYIETVALMPWQSYKDVAQVGDPNEKEALPPLLQRYHVYQCDRTGAVWIVYENGTQPVPRIHTEGRSWIYIVTTALLPTYARAKAWAIDYVRGPRAQDG